MENILVEKKNRIGFIILNRPEKRNALNDKMIHELMTSFQSLETDEEVKIIVIRANGNVFCSGADLEYLQQLQQFTYEENLRDSTRLMELYKRIYTSDKIVIAQVQGHALAGGCGLASVCDFVFSVPEANFGYTESRIGFVPAIVMVFLLRKISEAKAKELLLTGNVIKSKQALEFGLINYVIDDKHISEAVETFAIDLSEKNSAQSMKLTKKMIAAIPSMSLDDALAFACQQNATARGTEDCKKGIAAFLAKEKITW